MSQPNVEFTAPSEPPPLYDRRSLPAGWVKEHDPQTDRDYYVDTLAQPPRSIWVHPLDDPEFVRLHRGDDASDMMGESDDGHSAQSHSRPTSATSDTLADDKRKKNEFSNDKKSRRRDDDHLQVPSTAGAGSSSSGSRPSGHARTESATSTSSVADGKKRGFFGKLKDKAIGTKEEREAARKERERRRAEEERLYYERRDAMLARHVQQMEEQRAAYARAGGSGHPGLQGRQDYYYSRPAMNAYGGPTYQDPYQYGRSPYGYGQQQPRYYQQQRSSGLGGGGALLGGLVGGLLLGDLLF